MIVAMVADDEASRNVWLGDDGALAASRPQAILIESSTLSPPWVAELARAAEARGCRFLDAPVGGSKPAAAAGKLMFFVGGEADALQAARPVLEAVGAGIHHLGATGAGAKWKLINNMILGTQVAALGEALRLAERAGFDLAKVVPLILSGSGASPIVQGRPHADRRAQLRTAGLQCAFDPQGCTLPRRLRGGTRRIHRYRSRGRGRLCQGRSEGLGEYGLLGGGRRRPALKRAA